MTKPLNSDAQMSTGDTPKGFLYAFGAYAIWGGLPVYMKMTSEMPTLEVLSHRVIWSLPIALAVLLIIGRTADLRAALRNPRMMGMGLITASLISVNWGLYVYAMQSGQALQAALGYYINPLVSIVIGSVLLGERLSKLQWGAVALAAIAVLVLTIEAGRVPVLALALTGTWAAYAYFKRSLPIGPNQGFALEAMILLPFALGYVIWLPTTGAPSFFEHDALNMWLLIGCGIVTAVPLMLYANGAKLLRLSTIGIMQYFTPTLIFLTAIFAFGETFERGQMIAFPMIWTAMGIYIFSLVRNARH